MAQALIFLAPGYEEVEMLTVVDMLRRAGITIDMVSVTDELPVTGSHNVTIIADVLLVELDDTDFQNVDALILPGGIPGTPHLRACEPLCHQLIECNQQGKLIAAVCAAPTVLSSLGILNGRQATCYPSFADKLPGAVYIKKPVVIDGNVITSRGMGTCIEFAGAVIETLLNRETAEEVKEKIIYNDTYE